MNIDQDDIIITTHVKKRFIERFKSLSKNKVDRYLSRNDSKIAEEIKLHISKAKKSNLKYYKAFLDYNIRMYGKNDYLFFDDNEVFFIGINIDQGLLIKTCYQKNKLLEFLEEKYNPKTPPIFSLDSKTKTKLFKSPKISTRINWTSKVKNIKVYRRPDYSPILQRYYYPNMDIILLNQFNTLKLLQKPTESTGIERITEVANKYIRCLDNLKNIYNIKGSFKN
jgi:hypothetical protein